MLASLVLRNEWMASDPFGRVKAADRATGAATDLDLRAARGGYASFRVVVKGSGQFSLDVVLDGALEVDLYRAWFHPFVAAGKKKPTYYSDALVPMTASEEFAIPNPDNRIKGQTAQEFWVDVYAPRNAKPGKVTGSVRLTVGTKVIEKPLEIEVLAARLPEKPSFMLDNNSYGARLFTQYPKTLGGEPSTMADWRKVIKIMQHYYRLAHEHRMVFHNLGYGHSGKFDPIYGPRVTGSGRDLRLTDWGLFDEHYGPLLDGTAFATAAPGMPRPRQAALPIWGVYTPINPSWPADYLWWGEPGYEEEFTRGVAQFDEHFREKGWTKSYIEFFFNHKKRFRWFEWDGDEGKFGKDDAYHVEMIRMWKKAIGKSKVPWVYRADVSWRMKQQFDSLYCGRNFWVSGGFCAWYPKEIERVIERGDITTNYGGYPKIDAASSAALQPLYLNWSRGMCGFIEWLANSPGSDPWFASNGNTDGTFYSGERFGIEGPIPSARLKIMRNGLQDLDLLQMSAKDAKQAKAARAKLVKNVGVPVWTRPPLAARTMPAEDWDSANLKTEHEPIANPDSNLGSQWWNVVRTQAFEAAAKKGS